MQHHTSRAMYGVMLAAGIEIIEYEPSFLHAKVAVFDGPQGAIATVGSSNLDPISLLLAREANVFVRDDAFAEELRGHLLDAVRTHRRADRFLGAHEAAVHGEEPRLAGLRADARRPVRNAPSLLMPPTMSPADDLVVQRAEGLYCPPGDFYIDPWRPVERAVITHAHADHSRARPRPLPRRRAGRGRAAHAPRRGHRPADAGLRRGDRAPRRAGQLPSGRPRARLGAGAARASRPGLGRLGRLLRRRRRRRPARGQRHLRAVRAGALPLLHHRIDLRPADLPLAAAGRAVRRDRRLVAAATPKPAAPACSSATPSARRSASWPASTARSGRSSCTARSSR